MSPGALIEALCRLGREEFDEVLLNLDDSVRRHVPGEVASRVQRAEAMVRMAAAALEPQVARLDQARRRDPLRDWRYQMLARARELPVVGFRHESRYRLALEDVYESLTLERAAAREGVDAVAAMAAACRLATRTQHRGIAVVGLPGAGKTTTLQWLHAQAEYQPGALGLAPDTVPVMLSLSTLSAGVFRGRGLVEVLEAEAERRAKGAWAAITRRQLPLLVLLDGLDEVLDDDEREEVACWLVDEMPAHDGWRYVVSCRVAAWERARTLESRLVRHDVAPLQWEQVERFVHKWYRAVHLADRAVEAGELDAVRAEAEAEGDGAAKLFLPQLRAREREEEATWRGLSRVPLLLSTICLVHAKEGGLPTARAKLYEECLGILLRARTRRDTKLGFRDADAAIAVLRPLATHLQDGDAGRSVTEAKAAELVGPRLDSATRLPDKDRAAFLRRVRDCGVLVAPDRGKLAFFHQTAQEYLAAREKPEALVARLGRERWREPLRLAASMDGEGELVAALLDADVVEHEVQVRDTLLEGVWRDRETFQAALRPERSDEELRAVLRIAGAVGVKVDVGPLQQRLGIEDGGIRRWTHPKTGIECVWVPAETFLYGKEKRPVVEREGFWIGRFPVTNQEYGTFLKEKGAREPRFWSDGRFNRPRQPVVGVTWDEAVAFCAWAGGFLPAEEQWEHMARGADGREYPWGADAPTAARAAFGGDWDAGAPDVGAHPGGRSPCGAEDVAGTAWEWTMTTWQDDDNSRVLRGGSWVDVPVWLRCVARVRDLHGGGNRFSGFRVGFRSAPRLS